MRVPRKGEFVCNCDVYKFPHRFYGGRCRGDWIPISVWHENYGGGICKTCNMNNDGFCAVVEDLDESVEGDCFMDFVHYNGITINKA